MSTETMVLKIAGLLGSDRLPQIRKALNVPGPEKKTQPLIDWKAKLEVATTVKKCLDVYGNAPSGSELETEALKKALSLATTVKECWDVYDNAPSGSKLRKEALKKIESLLRPKLEAATTVKKCLDVYGNALSGSELRKEALKKALSLATTVEDLKTVFRKTDQDSPEAYNCIRAIAKLLDVESTK